MTNLDQDPTIIQSDILDKLKEHAAQARIAGDNHSASIETQIAYIEFIMRLQEQTGEELAASIISHVFRPN